MKPDSGSSPEHINQLIWKTVCAIPPGSVCTYGEVADMAGLGRAARRVGRALRDLPADSPVPWHRVLRAGGHLAFTPGSGPYRRQLERLAAEGVPLVRGRVDLGRFGWRQDLDQLLWGAPPDEDAG